MFVCVLNIGISKKSLNLQTQLIDTGQIIN